jgi:hypothetical protein
MACCDLVAWGVWAIWPARAHQLALGGPLARASRAEHTKPKCLTSSVCVGVWYSFSSNVKFFAVANIDQ